MNLSIIESADGGERVIGKFTDLSEEFDCVDLNHNILLSKLGNLSFARVSLNYLKSYFKHRKENM